jgi:adenylate cyclase
LEDLWQDRLFNRGEAFLRTGDERIIIAAMDDDTGRKYGFPLPRRLHVKLLDKLKGYGVKTVAFDVLFTNSRENDRELAEATARFKRVVHLFALESKQTPLGEVVSTSLPVPTIEKSAQYLGYPNVDQVLDSDGHVRRVMLFDRRVTNPRDAGQFGPSLDAAAMASFLDKPLSDFLREYADPEPRILHLNFRASRLRLLHPKRDQGLVGKVANLQEIESPYQWISYGDILSGELSEGQKKSLRGALVIVGSTSLGYFDHYPTPFNPQSPGAEYHANLMDNMLNQDFLREASRTAILLALILMIWLPVLLLRLSPTAGSVVGAGVLVLWYGLSVWVFSRGLRFDFVAPLAAFLTAFLVQTVYRVRTEGQEKKFIKNLFGQFVAPEVVEDLAKDPTKIKLGGEKRDLTMFFLDIRHFTTISERMSPEELIAFLNRYLSALSRVVHEHKGVVDKYIGDCIMAFWNAPIALKDHRAKACLAAIGCQEVVRELNKDLAPGLPEVPAIRIGLNSGEATVGLTGSEKKLQYTVIGDEVNLASRLEGANKFFGTQVMVSESTFQGARGAVEGRELGRVLVVGKQIPIRVFELLARKGGLSPEWGKALPLYEKGLAHFDKREFTKAAASFQDFLKVLPEDGPGRLYYKLAVDYSTVSPPKDWDGVFKLAEK